MSENMESMDKGEVREAAEQQDTEGQRLQDATAAPEAHVEQTQDYQQAEAVEQELKQSVDTVFGEQERATTGIEEGRATPIPIPGGGDVPQVPEETTGESPAADREKATTGIEEGRATPIPIPGGLDDLELPGEGPADAEPAGRAEAVEGAASEVRDTDAVESAEESEKQAERSSTGSESKSEAVPEQPLQEAEYEKPILREDIGRGEEGGKPSGGFEGFPGAGEDSGEIKPPGIKGDLFEDPMQPPDPTLGKEDFKAGLDEGLMGADPSEGMMDPGNDFGMEDDMFSSKGGRDGSPNPLIPGKAPGHISGSTKDGGQGSITYGGVVINLDELNSTGSMSTIPGISQTALFLIENMINDPSTPKSVLDKAETWLQTASLDYQAIGTTWGQKDSDPDLGGAPGPQAHLAERFDQSHISNITPDQAGQEIDASPVPEAAKKLKAAFDAKRDAIANAQAGPKVNPEEVTDPPAPGGQADKQASQGGQDG